MSATVQRRGFTESSYVVCNPLPTLTDEEILKDAGLPKSEPKPLSPFRLIFKYGSGAETETLALQPGDEMIFRESDAKTFQRVLKEEGGCIWPMDADEGTIQFSTGCGGSGACGLNVPTIDSRSCAGIFNTQGFVFLHSRESAFEDGS